MVLAFEKNWNQLANRPRISGLIGGINASVVGLLAATLYTPIFVSSVFEPMDMVIAALGFLLLRFIKLPIIHIIILGCIVAVIRAWLGA